MSMPTHASYEVPEPVPWLEKDTQAKISEFELPTFSFCCEEEVLGLRRGKAVHGEGHKHS